MSIPKTHVVLIDGTGCDRRAGSAVSRLAEPLEAAGMLPRYLRGVGSQWHSRVRGGAGGFGLSRQMRLAWSWLAVVADPNDRIVLLGYSRGGSAVISLANLLDRCGLVEINDDAEADRVAREAMSAYSSREGYRNWAAARFAERHRSRHWRPRVAFLGVFDAVGAAGMGMPRWLARATFGRHELDLPDCVEAAAQALAADEKRWSFRPAIWTSPARGRHVAQAWFPGHHGDIGGVTADDSVRWMVACAREAGVDLPDAPPPLDRAPRTPRVLRRSDRSAIDERMVTGMCLHETHADAGIGRWPVVSADAPWSIPA